MLTHFKNISCYEEFEIQSALTSISKVNVLKEIGHKINDYYFFMSKDGVFNWFDLNGNYIENPGVLKELRRKYIADNIVKCIIPDSITSIGEDAFWDCESLKEIIIPNSITYIGSRAFRYCESLKEIIFKGKTLDEIKRMENYPFGIKDESIIKVYEI